MARYRVAEMAFKQRNWNGTITTMNECIICYGRDREAGDLVVQAHWRIAQARERMKRVHNVLSLSQAPRPRVVVLEWTDPPFVAGHWVPEMIHRAGGVDVFAVPGQHSRQVLWDSIVDAAPAVVLVAPCGYDAARAALEGEALIRKDPWLTRRTVWAVDAARLVSQPGPSLVEGIETFAAIMHPTLFTAPTSSNALQLTTA